MATIEDNRMRNPEHVRQIQQIFAPAVLRSQMGDFHTQDIPEPSISGFLDETDDFREWARMKAQRNTIEPENCQPVRESNSPASDWGEVEFTRVNKTDGSILLSLSSLNIPTASNASLTINNSTPSLRLSIPNRKSNTTPRRSNYPLTPRDIIRNRQTERFNVIKKAEREGRSRKQTMTRFEPTSFSTPVRTDRKKSSMIPTLAQKDPDGTSSAANATKDKPPVVNNEQNEQNEQSNRMNTS